MKRKRKNRASEGVVELPIDFLNLLKESASTDYDEVLDALQQSSVTSVRFNPFKSDDSIRGQVLSSFNSEYTQIPWCEDGFVLKSRPIFTLDPAFHAGIYYVQEPSSMILEVLRPLLGSMVDSLGGSAKLNVLDAAAAPGGKTTHLISLLPQSANIVANEVIRSRVSVLAENVAKWGRHDVIVTNNDPSHFSEFDSLFNLILVDAPCSGEGMFRKGTDREAINQWSLNNVKLCASRQSRILDDLWPALSPGGVLIYSTCTYNRIENDENLLSAANRFSAEIISPRSFISQDDITKWGLTITPAGAIQFFPGLSIGEGLYIGLLRKKGSIDEINLHKSLNFDKAISNLSRFNYNQRWQELSKSVANKGSKAVKRDKEVEIIPEHNWAYSLDYARESDIPSVELDKVSALRFLSKDEIKLDHLSSWPIGFIRVTYLSQGIGFIKNIGTRLNNLLPISKRIRMIH